MPTSHGPAVCVSNPAWAPALPGTCWISYRQTGDRNQWGWWEEGNGTRVIVLETLDVPGIPVAAGVTFRADDSADLYVNGWHVVEEAPAEGNTYQRCSDFAPGCTPELAAVVNLLPYIETGANHIRFDFWQRAGHAFGLNYSGFIEWRVPDVATPEPGTCPVVLFVLMLIYVLWRIQE